MPIELNKCIWALLLTVASHTTTAAAEALPCDDGIKQAFRPDANTLCHRCPAGEEG
jgi:hypothetical protein